MPTNGSLRWRYKYCFNGKENRIALGCYPLISIVTARKMRNEAKELLAQGINPSLQKKALKEQTKAILKAPRLKRTELEHRVMDLERDLKNVNKFLTSMKNILNNMKPLNWHGEVDEQL